MLEKENKDKVNSLLNLKKEELKDITLLDLEYHTVISFSLLGEDIPIYLKLEDITYKDARASLKTRGKDIPIIHVVAREKNTKFLVDNLFKYIEWDALDLFTSDEFFYEKYNNIRKKYEINGTYNYYLMDKELDNFKEEIKYNLKSMIIDKCFIDSKIEDELINIYLEIQSIQIKMLNEFDEILEKIMDFKDKKNINFIDQFQVMLKAGVINSSQPIFKENIGKAFSDYSFREIRLRMAFEQKETILNANKLNMMLPIMVKSSLL